MKPIKGIFTPCFLFVCLFVFAAYSAFLDKFFDCIIKLGMQFLFLKERHTKGNQPIAQTVKFALNTSGLAR